MSSSKEKAFQNLKRKKVVTATDRLSLLEGEWSIIVDTPNKYISRVTLNNPEWENRINNRMRAQIYEQLQLNDQNPDVRVTIIRGAGKSFCAGYEQALSSKDSLPMPMFTNTADGEFQRNTLEGWFMIMDLAKPVIAQVHGKCISAGSELASACDLVYTTPTAEIGYPEVRNYGLPDFQMYPWLTGLRNALSIMLLAETMDGETAVKRGWATGVFSEEELEKQVLEKAKRVAMIPADLLTYNKRSVHRAFEHQGMRTSLRHGTDLEALMWHSNSAQVLRRAETLYLRGGSASTKTAERTPKPANNASAGKTEPAQTQSSSTMVSNTQSQEDDSISVPRPPRRSKAGPTQGSAALESPEQSSSKGLQDKKPVALSPNPQLSTKVPKLTPTPVSNRASDKTAEDDGVYIYVNKPIAIHIHTDDQKSKL